MWYVIIMYYVPLDTEQLMLKNIMFVENDHK